MGFHLSQHKLHSGPPQQPLPLHTVEPELPQGGPRWGYGQILDKLDVGVLVLDLEHRQIDYRNPFLSTVLQDETLCDSFDKIERLLLTSQDPPQHGPASMSVPLGDRTFGCSIYAIGSRYRCIFIRDISEKLRLESIAQAVNTMDNIGFIFSSVRHEIGNPLNSLKMALSVLRNNLDEFERQTVEEYIDRGLGDIARVEYLLKSMRSFSMYERLELQPVELRSYLRQFLALLERDLRQRGIDLVFNDDASPCWVKIDSRALHQVLLNLIANAVDALQGIEGPQIHVFVEERDALARLVISDNGCGLTEKQKVYLFKPFNTTKPQGSGLGLVITRKLLAQMNAAIAVESSRGHGTLVLLSFPVGSAQETDGDSA